MDTSRVDGVKAPQTPKFKIQDTELHGLRVLRLAEDLEQLVGTQKIEARKRGALRLDVLVQRLLDLVERVIVLEEHVFSS